FFPVFYFILYKTKLGIKLMDSFSKKKRLVKLFSSISIYVGFGGMLLICFLLVYNLYKVVFVPSVTSGVALVLPVKVKGAFFVPFFYWIISIVVIASVHEFCHGWVARHHNIKIKSSGFAFLALFLPIVPAAFVEPDEKQLARKKKKQQLQVFAAGPFSNILLGFFFLALFGLVGSHIVEAVMDFQGVSITTIANDSVLLPLNISVNDSIIAVDNINTTYIEDFKKIMENKSAGQQILLSTNKGNYSVILGKNPKNASKGYLGVTVSQNKKIKQEVLKEYGVFLPNAAVWVVGLFFWLYVLNLGIGIFNLVPVGPVDGGRMLFVGLQKYFTREKAQRISSWVSFFFLVIIVLNIVVGFLK
ncbi:MAG: site-2 protease family protein, partial [Candidatus Woesearchaeota archaeon]